MSGGSHENSLRREKRDARCTEQTLPGNHAPSAYDTTARDTMFIRSSMVIARAIGHLREILPLSLSQSGLIATTL